MQIFVIKTPFLTQHSRHLRLKLSPPFPDSEKWRTLHKTLQNSSSSLPWLSLHALQILSQIASSRPISISVFAQIPTPLLPLRATTEMSSNKTLTQFSTLHQWTTSSSWLSCPTTAPPRSALPPGAAATPWGGRRRRTAAWWWTWILLGGTAAAGLGFLGTLRWGITRMLGASSCGSMFCGPGLNTDSRPFRGRIICTSPSEERSLMLGLVASLLCMARKFPMFLSSILSQVLVSPTLYNYSFFLIFSVCVPGDADACTC